MVYRYLGSIFSWVMRSFLFASSIYYIYKEDFFGAIIIALSLGFALIPEIIRMSYNVKLHWIYDVLFTVIITGHMIGFMGMYEQSLIYDDFLHIIGSFILGIIGFMIIYSYDYSEKIKITIPFLMFFTILWTLGIGAIWEIVEFLWDNIALLSSEYGFAQDSLLDTMTDLSWDFICGVLATMFMASIFKKMHKDTKERLIQPIANLLTAKNKSATI
ncbi:MAG: hypothetical protein V1906_00750 [Candidatus Woesearchaeota archaeon]